MVIFYRTNQDTRSERTPSASMSWERIVAQTCLVYRAMTKSTKTPCTKASNKEDRLPETTKK